MKRSNLLPGVCLVAGAVGIMLRRWQLATAFEAGTNLPIRGSTATIVLIGACVVVAAILFLLSTGKTIPHSCFASAFHCSGFLYFLGMCAAGALTIAAGVFALLDWTREHKMLLILFAVCAIFCGVCIMLIGAKNYKNSWTGRGSLLLLMPPFTCCLWLMLSYQNWARDPVVTDYVFALFSIMACMLACYYISAYGFALIRPTMIRFTSALSMFFCLIALADSPNSMNTCMHLGMLLYILANLVAYLRNSHPYKDFNNPNAPRSHTDLSTKEASPS